MVFDNFIILVYNQLFDIPYKFNIIKIRFVLIINKINQGYCLN